MIKTLVLVMIITSVQSVMALVHSSSTNCDKNLKFENTDKQALAITSDVYNVLKEFDWQLGDDLNKKDAQLANNATADIGAMIMFCIQMHDLDYYKSPKRFGSDVPIHIVDITKRFTSCIEKIK